MELRISSRVVWTLTITSVLILAAALFIAEMRQRQFDHDEAVRAAERAAHPPSNHREPTPIRTKAPRARAAVTIEPDPVVEEDEPVEDVEVEEDAGE